MVADDGGLHGAKDILPKGPVSETGGARRLTVANSFDGVDGVGNSGHPGLVVDLLGKRTSLELGLVKGAGTVVGSLIRIRRQVKVDLVVWG